MKSITLARPIPYGKETLTELKLREPKAGDLRGIQLRDLNVVDVDTTLRLAARLSTTHIVEEQLSELHPYDLSQLSQVVIGFFEKPDSPSPTIPGAPTES